MQSWTYKEEQFFEDKIIYFLLTIGAMGSLYGVLITALRHMDLGRLVAFLMLGMVFYGALWLLKRIRMKLSINEHRIKFKMTPHQKRSQKISWDEVDSYEIVKTPNMAQWLGRNISFREDHVVSLAGRNGISLKTKSGESYFIGCKNPEKLAEKIQSFVEL